MDGCGGRTISVPPPGIISRYNDGTTATADGLVGRDSVRCQHATSAHGFLGFSHTHTSTRNHVRTQ